MAFRAFKQAHVRTALGPLLVAVLNVGAAFGIVSHVQRACVGVLGIQIVLLYQIKHQLRCTTKSLIEFLARFRAQNFVKLIGLDPRACVDQANIAPRATVSQMRALQNAHALPQFAQADGGG